MGAFILLLFIGMIWGLITISDTNVKDKGGIILSEIIITILPFICFVFYLSKLVMDNTISMGVSWLLFVTIPILVGLLFHSYNKKRFKKIDDENMRIVLNQIEWDKRIQENRRIKKERYMESLQSGNKSNALQLGREYYSSIGLYDEQRIQNDLLCFLNIK